MSPLPDELRMDEFLRLLQGDLQRLEVAGQVDGQLVQRSEIEGTDWTLNLTVPISNELGESLLGRLVEDL
jgi:hypothetical protein